MEKHKHERSTFSGKLGFVLSAAGASVGLGNIWRFPYLAAKYGGGIFLLVYIILALTFGYTMIVAETALGRMTKKSPVGAFGKFGKSGWLSFGGWINAIIPVLIVPYYSVIGGWVIKYLVEYIKGNSAGLATDGYFSEFISGGVSTEVCFIVFSLITLLIIYAGVQNGVERVSKFMMPVLVVLSVVIVVYSVTRPGAMEGVKYFLVPNPANFSWMTVVAAMGQMFYSLISIARAFLRNAPILIMDEATSALDSKTEKHVSEAMGRLRSGRTCLVVAHRLSTIADADRIVVMKDGCIIEIGSYNELMAAQGAFARLVELQTA